MACCSGFAALVYEVAWARMLALTFGSTTLSAAAVVAGFMGGMGLGAWLYHHLHSRTQRPLLDYAGLELGIALSAATLSLIFYSLPALLAHLSGPIGSGPPFQVVRFLGAFALILLPAMLMGATYPALCTVVIRSAPGVDRHLGVIYGINTAGAAIGALVAGLWLIDWLGLRGATGVAVLANGVVGVSALALWRKRSTGAPSPSADPVPSTARAESVIPTGLPRTVTGIVLFASGFCGLAYEILWFRVLRYTMGTSTYALTVVLFTFLVGLALGSFMLRRAARRSAPEGDLAMCQLLIAVLSLAAMAAYVALPEIPSLFEQLSFRSAIVKSRPWLWRLAIDGGFAVATMLPATVLMGLSFPLATRLFLGDVRRLDARVGAAYVLANLGGVLGAVGAAVALLPLLGTIGGAKLCAAVNVALAAIIYVAMPRLRGRGLAFTVACVAVVAALIVALPSTPPLRGEKLDDNLVGDVIFSEEGNLATVQVLEDPRDQSRRAMAINGIKIGWSAGFSGTPNHRKQLLLAHLPMVLDGHLRKALAVGLGSAATLGSLASYPHMELIDCVEINGTVSRACQLFPECDVLGDPRVSLVIDDALHYLLATGPPYDLIVSDGKQDQLNSANAAMLCREYYRYARERLSAGGLMVQWLQLGMLHRDLRIVLRTACAVFDHVELFFFPPSSVLWIGSQQPLADRQRLPSAKYTALAAGEMSPYHLLSTASLVGHWVAGKEQLEPLIGDGPHSTWDHLILDSSPFRASRQQWQQAAADNLDLLIRASSMPRTEPGLIATSGEEAYFESQRLLRRALLEAPRNPRRARQLAQKALDLNRADGEVRRFLKSLKTRRQ